MSYIDMAYEVKEQFVTLLDAILIKKSMNEYNRDDFYIYTGKIATIYGHAFLNQYDPKALIIIFQINELIASLTYATFSLEDEKITLTSETLKHFKEVRDELNEIVLEDKIDINEPYDLELIKEKLLMYLNDNNIKKYNEELRQIISFGEYKYNHMIKENEGYGDDDNETDDYEFTLYESNKEADEELEYYYNVYNELLIDVTEYYDINLIKKNIQDIH